MATASGVNRKKAREIEPRISPDALGAVYTEGTSDVNAHRLTLALAMAAERSQLRIYQETDEPWPYPRAVAKRLEWNEKQIQVRNLNKLLRKSLPDRQ